MEVLITLFIATKGRHTRLGPPVLGAPLHPGIVVIYYTFTPLHFKQIMK